MDCERNADEETLARDRSIPALARRTRMFRTWCVVLVSVSMLFVGCNHEKRKFEVPTKLIADGSDFRVDATSLETVDLAVTKDLVTGFAYRHAGGVGYGSGTRLAEGPRVKSGDELTIVVFETDVPPQHHWMPEAGQAYRPLLTKKLRAP
jgi:hypothetical protein